MQSEAEARAPAAEARALPLGTSAESFFLLELFTARFEHVYMQSEAEVNALMAEARAGGPGS